MKHTMDLTKGNIYKEYCILTFPLLIGNILQQFYNAADAWIIGRYVGQNAFNAVGVGGTIMNLFIFLLAGCCSGFSVLFAQFYGASDLKAFRKETYLSAVYGGILTLLLSAAALLCLSPLLRITNTPEEVFHECKQYLSIVCIGLIASYYYNLCASMLRAIGNTMAALVILFIAMLLNIGLDFLFAAKLGLGIRGAAWATVAAQSVSVILCFVYIKIRLPQLLFKREDAKLDSELLKRSLSLGMLSALHQSSLYIGKLLVQSAVNSAGNDMITAYTAATRIEGFANSFGDSGAAAMSILIAQNIGKGKIDRVREGFRKGLLILIFMGLAASLILYVTAQDGIVLMSSQSSADILSNGIGYMKLIAVFYVLCYVGNGFVGWFRGLGMVNVPVLGTCFHITIRVILSWLLIGQMGLRAVALATGIGWICVVSFQTLVWKFSKKQKEILNV